MECVKYSIFSRQILFNMANFNTSKTDDEKSMVEKAETHKAQVIGNANKEEEEEFRIFRLNIGGKSYRFRQEVILACREPNSLLSLLIKADHRKRMVFVDGFIEETGEYYLERNSRIAEYVIEYFLTGKLHKPQDICLERFREELAFWHLVNVELAPCCSILVDPSKIEESIETELELDEVSCMPEFRKVVWHLMENPSSSIFAKCFSVVSIGFIFVSVLGLILGSMPEFQEDSRFAEFYHLNLQRKGQRGNLGPITFDNSEAEQLNSKSNNMNYFQKYQNMTEDGSAMVMLNNNSAIQFFYKPTDNPHHHLIQLEYLCIAWFTLEFWLRFMVAPRKWKFMKKTMNLIDLFTFLPFFFELGLSLVFGVNAQKLKEIIGAMLVIRILRVLRMARVFKLARYSTGLQVFGNTLQSSLKELCMLSMFLVTGTIFFSTIIFFLEKDEPGTDFRSIPAACWWCIITVTTVGYGDCLIQTSAGKTVAAIASIFGIIILAFPISMVVENFAFAQQQSQVENQMREAQMAAVANDYLMKRYPSRRKACREPLASSVHHNTSSAYHSIRHANRRLTSTAIID